MAVQSPSIQQMRDLAAKCGLSLSDADLESYRAMFAGSIAAYNVVDAMPDEVPPVKYPRTEGVYKEWIAAAKAGTQPGSNFAGHAGPLTEMVLIGNLAVRLARPVELDPATGAVRSPEVPVELVTPRFREGWGV